MKKIYLITVLMAFAGIIYGQTSVHNNFVIEKTSPQLHLKGSGGIINFNSGDVTLTNTSNTLTIVGGVLALPANGLLINSINALYGITDTITDLYYTKTATNTLLAGKQDTGVVSMTYPGSGIALSTGSAWGSSITNNSTNWNTAYTDRLKWDGGATDLVAATGRASLGGTTVGQALFTLTNPSAITFPRINADNSVTALSATNFKTAIAIGQTDVGSLPDSLLARYTKAQDTVFTAAMINDTINAIKAIASVGISIGDTVNGSTGNDYVPGTDYMKSYVETYAGGELSGSILRFIVGITSGAPSVGDSLIIHSAFENKHIDLYRNGNLQYFHTEAVNTIDSTFRINGDTIFVRPDWVNNERVEIRASNAIAWTDLSLEGEESNLLTGLKAYYKINESTIHSAFVDETGTRNSNTVYLDSIKTGILSYGRKFNYKGSTSITNNDSINPHGSAFSVSCWIKLDSLASTAGDSYIWAVQNTTSPTVYHYLNIGTADNKLTFMSYSATPTLYSVKSSGALSIGVWYHIVAVRPASGGDLKLYVNGADVSATTVTVTGAVREADSYFRIANVAYNYVNNLQGIIDELGIWSIALTSDQVTELYNSGVGKTYPFL